jgi:class 3 adenylate cyclase/pimeloyl-ACP methyl ester carboxylesterase/DNA-binding CsgD family transcriptional regulator
MFTDVVGSTALSIEEGDEHARGMIAHSARLVREAVLEHGGREVKGLGDGSLCAFRGPRAAIASATDLQRAHERWQRASEDGSVAVRVGIHTGEVSESEGDLHGEAVNAAARICAAAGPWEILASATACGAAGSGARLPLMAREPVELKGFPKPFEVAAVEWRSSSSPRPAMEQRVRFCEVEGHRIAWAEVGSGPPLVVPPAWVGNLHNDWESDEYRRFVERLATGHKVIRYDRPGTGLSDRSLPGKPSLDMDIRVLEGLVAEIGGGPVSVYGISCGGCIALGFAARNPAQVTSLVFSGCYIDGARLAPPAVRESLVAVIRANWGLGARMLSDIFVPGGTQAERREWARFQRASAEADVAAELYELVYRYDASRAVEYVTAPALVLHRRHDTAVNFALGRELAASLPNASFVPLEGMRHLPWQGDSEATLSHALAFLAEHEPTSPVAVPGLAEAPFVPPTPRAAGMRGPVILPELSARELEVLRLVAKGSSDREIAERLVLSPHTVHRHVANIRTKLGQPSRAAAAVQATKLDLI